MIIDDAIQQSGQKEKTLIEAIFERLHVALPGEVISYDQTNRTAQIVPTVRNWRCSDDPPILLDVPVFFPGNYTFPVTAGDECLVIFADTCIDGWFQNSGINVPMSARRHDLSDGFALVGFFSAKKATGGINLTEKLAELEQRIEALEEGGDDT